MELGMQAVPGINTFETHVAEAGRFCLLWQTCSCYTRSFARQSRICGSTFVPMELCGPQRSSETMLTHSEHREYRSLLGNLQWLQLQSRPDLSYEVNRGSSAPTIADARALNAISLKAQRSSETTLRYPRGVAQLCGDASFANMEDSKSQCGVIVFLTHEPWRFWHGEFQLGRLVYWTSSTVKRVVRSLAELWPSVPCSLPRSLRTVAMDSVRRPIATLSDSFALCQAIKSEELDRTSDSEL